MNGLQTARTVIIDDEPQEAMPLVLGLAKLGIGTVYFSGDIDQLPQAPLPGIRLVFLDLRLVGSPTTPAEKYIPHTLNILARAVALGHRSTGIVFWTNYEDDVQVLESRMRELLPHFTPLFLLNLGNKAAFVEGYRGGDFAPLQLQDDIAQLLSPQHAEALLWEWEQAVHDAATDTTNVINELVGSSQDANALKLLATLTAASAGQVTLESQAAVLHLFETLNPLHYDQLENRARLHAAKGEHADQLEHTLARRGTPQADQIARLNGMLLTAPGPESSTLVRPGDLFVARAELRAKCPVTRLEVKTVELADGLARFTKDEAYGLSKKALDKARTKRAGSDDARITRLERELDSREETILNECLPILLEIAPICDFAQNKRPLARFVAGILVPDQHAKVFGTTPPYTYRVPPCAFPGLTGTWHLILNARFSYGLRNPKGLIKSVPLCRLRRALLADVQAWCAAHAARPGYVSVR